MLVTKLRRYCMVLPLFAAFCVMFGGKTGKAEDTATLLGMSDRTVINPRTNPAPVGRYPRSNPAPVARNPRDFRIAATPEAATRKEYYSHKYRLGQIEKAMRKLEWEYQNGGGFIPSEVAAYRQKVKISYQKLKAAKMHEMQSINYLAQRLRQLDAAAAASRRTTSTARSGVSTGVVSPAQLQHMKFEEDLRRAQAKALIYRSAKPNPVKTTSPASKPSARTYVKPSPRADESQRTDLFNDGFYQPR